MADTFDDIEFDRNNRRCIKLTPAQYKIMTLLESFVNDLKEWYNGFDEKLDQLHAWINLNLMNHKYDYVASHTDICSYTYVHN